MHLKNHNSTSIWDDIGIEEKDCVAHYSKLKHLANILHGKKLLIGPVCKFDDPRESSMTWLNSVGYGHEPDLNTWRAVRKIKRKAGRQIRLLCTVGFKKSGSPISSLIEEAIYGRPRMWSQYGDRSRGFCIVLDKKALHRELLKIVENKEYLISGKVDYLDWLDKIRGGGAMIEYSPGDDLRNLDIFKVMNGNSKLKFLFFRKSIDWRDESEYRWLLFDSTEDPIYVPIKNSIKAVVLGYEFPSDQVGQVKAYCQELKVACYWLNYHHPQYMLQKIC